VAVFGSIASSVYRSELDLPPLPAEAAHTAEDSVAGAAAVAEALGSPETARHAFEAFTDGMGAVFLVCAVLAVVVAFAAGPRFPKHPGAEEAQSQHEPSRAA
jgi:hypothetical protein